MRRFGRVDPRPVILYTFIRLHVTSIPRGVAVGLHQPRVMAPFRASVQCAFLLTRQRQTHIPFGCYITRLGCRLIICIVWGSF